MSGPDREGTSRGATLPRERNDPADDVATARDAIRRTSTRYASAPRRPAPPRRPVLADHLRGFVRRYGWRAYALPVLAVVTVVAMMTSTSTSTSSASGPGGSSTPAAGAGSVDRTTAPAVAPSRIALKDDTPSGHVDDRVLKGYALPAGAPYTLRGKGTFRVLPGTSPKVGTGKLYRYSIDVENGIDDIDLAQYQSAVMRTLADPRSWSGHGVALKRVDSGPIDFHVTLTSSMTVRKWCGYGIHIETSCYAAVGSEPAVDVNRVVFNDSRWVRGSTAYIGDLASYRTYMINHEDGHALGHEHAHQCLRGGLAPAMMQQTFGLKSASTGKLCGSNPWPYPPGVKGAPGNEQPDTQANDEFGIGD